MDAPQSSQTSWFVAGDDMADTSLLRCGSAPCPPSLGERGLSWTPILSEVAESERPPRSLILIVDSRMKRAIPAGI